MEQKQLFVAPHLDDGAISFGGTLLAGQTKHPGEMRVVVATVFSRSNYTREGLGDAAVATPIRQAEEMAAMSSIGVATLFLGFPECPLRGYTISSPLDYPKEIKPELDKGLTESIAARLNDLFQDFDEVLIPLAIGSRCHVDHRIVREAAALSWTKQSHLRFRLYEDVPYIDEADRTRVSSLDGMIAKKTSIDLEAKLRLIRGYESQPIESWEDPIRRAAGQPPAEQTWEIKEPYVLEHLQEFDNQ